MILDTIIAHKRKELASEQAQVPLAKLESEVKNLPPTRDFGAACKPKLAVKSRNAITDSDTVRLIAEVKKKSPSKGIIREDFDPVSIAETYVENGAAAISVLTDKHFFAGELAYLRAIREVVDVPLLRKDFTIDAYHIYQARVAGADAILLIVAALTAPELRTFMDVAESLSLACLVEVHTQEELAIALDVDAQIIGINNRDLRTFHTDIATTFQLREAIPTDRIVVSESGIYSREDVTRLQQANVQAMLVGESLMRSPDIGQQVRCLIS
ncbi:MAG: indole-3-glycerol phosphate synthase TrpC [Candidatus Poribacteria bacterium]|nr:indole-3-glycerol phosphate synthase TrpC [Candidatus Poribacteria bacterium]